MELNQEETKGGIKWLVGAGLFAILFTAALFIIDQKLTYSKREEVLGETLYNLRSAQTSLPSRATDERQVEIATTGDIDNAAPHGANHQ